MYNIKKFIIINNKSMNEKIGIEKEIEKNKPNKLVLGGENGEEIILNCEANEFSGVTFSKKDFEDLVKKISGGKFDMNYRYIKPEKKCHCNKCGADFPGALDESEGPCPQCGGFDISASVDGRAVC